VVTPPTPSADAQVVIDYLRRQWDRPLRLTTVAMGLEATGRGRGSDLRLRIADNLAANPDLHPVVKRWGVATLVLDEDEKLLGRRLVQLGSGRTVSAAQLSADVGIAVDQLDHALTTLQHLQLISWQSHGEWLSYLMQPDYSQRLGPLGFNFHGVRLESGERFNVPCAFDYLLLAGSELAGERVEISDSCVHCTARIRAVIDRGRSLEADPKEALLFRGGS
jgi:hypothetical protein